MTERRTRAGRDLEHDIEEERRLRRAAITKATGQAPEPPEPSDEENDEDEEISAALRMEQQTLWVDLQVRKAMERGEFDNLPGAGKPIKGLGGAHDPNWWVKSLVEREQITGVLPPALALRKEDVELDAVIDKESTEKGVRRTVADFNRRVVEARRQLTGGPPVITPTRDEDAEVAAWRARIVQRREQQRRALEALPSSDVPGGRRRRWWHRDR